MTMTTVDKKSLKTAIQVLIPTLTQIQTTDTDTDTDTGAGTDATGGGGEVTATGGGLGPVTETKAGSYVGNFGGAEGVYIINNDNELAGLAISDTGSAQSLFGDIGAGDTFAGDLRQYIHQESIENPTTGSFGAVASLADPLSIDVTIVNGQTIESTEASPTAVALLGTEGSSVTPADAESLEGTWVGEHTFCCLVDDINNVLTTTLVFDGLTVSGSTQVDDGDVIVIDGVITEFGDGSLIDFNWGDTSGYSGVVFFTPSGDGRIAYIGEIEGGDTPTISGVLTRQ